MIDSEFSWPARSSEDTILTMEDLQVFIDWIKDSAINVARKEENFFRKYQRDEISNFLQKKMPSQIKEHKELVEFLTDIFYYLMERYIAIWHLKVKKINLENYFQGIIIDVPPDFSETMLSVVISVLEMIDYQARTVYNEKKLLWELKVSWGEGKEVLPKLTDEERINQSNELISTLEGMEL